MTADHAAPETLDELFADSTELGKSMADLVAHAWKVAARKCPGVAPVFAVLSSRARSWQARTIQSIARGASIPAAITS